MRTLKPFSNSQKEICKRSKGNCHPGLELLRHEEMPDRWGTALTLARFVDFPTPLTPQKVTT